MTTNIYKVNLTKPWQLLALGLSSIGVLALTFVVLQKLELGLMSLVIAVLISIFYFYILKKRIILKKEIGLSNNEILLSDQILKFEDISSYKIHRMRGAGLKLKLKDGKVYRLSSNGNFCKSDEFVRFVNDFESKVIDKPKIKKIKTFGETKFGFYFAICSTLSFISVLIFKMVTGQNLELSKIGLILGSLSTLWSGINVRKILATKG